MNTNNPKRQKTSGDKYSDANGDIPAAYRLIAAPDWTLVHKQTGVRIEVLDFEGPASDNLDGHCQQTTEWAVVTVRPPAEMGDEPLAELTEMDEHVSPDTARERAASWARDHPQGVPFTADQHDVAEDAFSPRELAADTGGSQ